MYESAELVAAPYVCGSWLPRRDLRGLAGLNLFTCAPGDEDMHVQTLVGISAGLDVLPYFDLFFCSCCESGGVGDGGGDGVSAGDVVGVGRVGCRLRADGR